MAASTWCRLGEASAIIGVNRCTLWRWISEGRIERRFLLQTGSQVRVARVWCEGRHLIPTTYDDAAQAQAPASIPFPAASTAHLG